MTETPSPATPMKDDVAGFSLNEPALAREVLPRPAAPVAGIGQTWRRADGTEWTTLGRKQAGWVLASTSDTSDRQTVSPEDLLDAFEYVSCDHINYCCTTHLVHVSPHRGCVLR